jgi:FixJ family two-component response regulator
MPIVHYINLSQGGADLMTAPMISIIDDDPFVRAATDGLVRSLGYRATTFAWAEDYLQFDRINDTSCIITDLQMPGMSGVELQSLLIARGNCTPMIFITAFPEEKVRARVLEAGAIGFLSKPFDEDHLIEHLQTALRSHVGGSAE